MISSSLLRSKVLPLFALIAVVAGCSAEAGTSSGGAGSAEKVTQAASDTSNDNIKPDGRGFGGPRGGGHRGPGAGGPDFLLSAALRAPINLTDAQKTTIESLVKSDHEAMKAKMQANKSTFEAERAANAKKLADSIRTNTVSATGGDFMKKPGFDPNNANNANNNAAHAEHIAASAKKLQTLHDTLTAEQRVQLVDSLNAKGGEKHEGGRGGRGGEGAGRGGHERGGPDGGFLADLNLTQVQKDAIKAKMDAQRPAKPTEEQITAMKAQHESMRTAMKSKLETFKADKFDATAFVTPPAKPAVGTEIKRPDHVNPLSIITPILTQAQREQLATRIEQGPTKARQ